jgi:uncharacterized RDD family membrane protein YckC
MQEEWYVELEGEASGPHGRGAVLQMRDAGRIDAASLVWRAGFAEWVRYADAGFELWPVLQHTPSAFDDSPAFDVPTDEAPPTEAELNHESTMRRAIALRNAVRGHAELADNAPVHAPRLEVEDDGWQWIRPAPWRRYLARVLDMFLLGWFTWMVLGIVLAAVNRELFGILFTHGGLMSIRMLSSVIVWASLIPVQALLIGTSGTTLGKWIFGVRITKRDGSAIGIRAAMAREASVFGVGMFGGAPVLAFVPMLIAYRVLTETGSTQWDRGKDWVVTQREPGDVQTGMFVLGMVVLFAMGTLIGHYEVMPR